MNDHRSCPHHHHHHHHQQEHEQQHVRKTLEDKYRLLESELRRKNDTIDKLRYVR